MRSLLGALGSPQADLPVAHIAGTKGKGSVTAMLQSILQESGYLVGTYTRHAGSCQCHGALCKAVRPLLTVSRMCRFHSSFTLPAGDRSPHLLTLRERISIDGRPIGSTEFDGLASAGLSAARAALADGFSSVTHFEMMTALALQHFQQQKVG
jgi:folylpolyglutamate synthase/dihydropteroate synthase